MKLSEICQAHPTEQLDESAKTALAAAAMFLASLAHAPEKPEGNFRAGKVEKPASVESSPRFKKMLSAISDKYSVDKEVAAQIIKLAKKHEKSDFPKAEDILAVIGIESSFNPQAKSKLKVDPAHGLMQVRPGVWGIKPAQLKTIDQQIAHGSEILSKYYAKLNKPESAISAYNIGLTNYLKKQEQDAGKRYLNKFKQERQRYS